MILSLKDQIRGKILSIHIPSKLAESLEKMAVRTKRPKRFLIRKALESFIAEYGDYAVAQDRLKDRMDMVITGREIRRRLAR